jgi:intracellular septation protein A
LYKVWGGIGLFFVFALLQGVWLSRHATEDPPTEETA